jgi:glycosyltransferase involved in cell wall biosynthesis
MTIGIDARMLGKGFGLARYIEQLLIQLDTLEHNDRFVVFLRPESIGVFEPVHADRFRFVLADVPWYSLAEQIKMPRIIKRAEVDVMHFPHFNVPLWYGDPFIVTIHDLTMFHFARPEATTRSRFTFWIKDKAHRFVIASAAWRAGHIITTSEYVRSDVHETLGIPMEKMTTVYQAPFGQGTSDKKQKTNTVLLRAECETNDEAIYTNNSTPYLLYVGAAYPHKNVEGLLDAWERYDGNADLVLVGQENYFWNRLKSRIEALPNVHYLGFQTDEQLETLYAGARAFTFPSLSEGFGIPPLEAMQRGVPVLSSSASCLPEVLGEGALYTDTTNPEMFAHAIDQILHDDAIRYELLLASKEMLSRYSLERFGKGTIYVYNTYKSKNAADE